MKTKISVSIEMPEKIKKEYKQPNLYEKVCDYMVVCESDADSYHHWNYLKCLYNKLHERSGIPAKFVPIMEKLEDFMSKHGQYDSGDNPAKMEGKNMFKYREDA